MGEFTLYDFPFSSASYRVRIALQLKQISYRSELINLREGAQQTVEYMAISKAGLVPGLRLPDGTVLTQSLAIMRYLDTIAEPLLFPAGPIADAKVSAMSLMIACDIHPLNNLRVLNYLQAEMSVSDAQKSAWYAHWVHTGLNALEAEVAGSAGKYCYGDTVTAADVCLVPQMANARRFGVDLSEFPLLRGTDKRLAHLESFRLAAPTS